MNSLQPSHAAIPPTVQPPSVRSLKCQMRFGSQGLSSGTGFVVLSKTTPFFITNRHNLTGRHSESGQPISSTGGVPDNILIYHHVAGLLGQWSGKIEELYEEDGTQKWREHPQYGSRADVVALPLTNTDGVDLYPYEITDEPRIAIAPGDVVSVVGFPFGMSTGGMLPIWATGIVASEPEVSLNDSDLPIFYIDCRSRKGQSGSAVIAHRSSGMVAMDNGAVTMADGPLTRLLGVYSGRVNEQSDIGIVWRTAMLHGLVELPRECHLGSWTFPRYGRGLNYL